MKAIKVTRTVDEKGKLALDFPLNIDKQSRVEVIVLIPEESETEENDQTKEEMLKDLNQAWQEVKNGETLPVEQLWED